MKPERYEFTAPVFEYEGPGSWHFALLPEEIADEVAERFGGGRGFGSIRVEAAIGGSVWRTSLFPDRKRGTYLLPVKKPVRLAEGLSDGSSADITLTVLADPTRT